MLALGSHEVRKSAWYIRCVAVHPDQQRRGIGRQLIQSVVDKVWTLSFLSVISDNLIVVYRQMWADKRPVSRLIPTFWCVLSPCCLIFVLKTPRAPHRSESSRNFTSELKPRRTLGVIRAGFPCSACLGSRSREFVLPLTPHQVHQGTPCSDIISL